MFSRLLFLFIFQSLATASLAVIETYDFSHEDNRQRYQQFVDELRCPKCQNQNLSGSNSPIARDLRKQVHRMVENGDSDAAIKEFMVNRYGKFVLYEPPLDMNTLFLWLFPFLALLIAGSFFVFRKRQQALPERTLTVEERQRLARILSAE